MAASTAGGPSSLHQIGPPAKDVPEGTWEVWLPTAALPPEEPPGIWATTSRGGTRMPSLK